VQLDELDDVTANAAPEAVKKPLVPVDVERRRPLAVKRAEPLVGRPDLLQRHVVLDHQDDIGLVFEVVNEGLGE
jgi:hypothetical protein